MVWTVVLAVLLAWCGVALTLIVLALARAERKARQIESSFRSFISAPDSATPSPLAQTVDMVAQVVARGVIMQAKATFMGEASAVAKAGAKAEGQAALGRYPWLAAIAGLAPGFQKSLLKNPAVLNLAGSLLGKAQAPAPAGNGHNVSEQVRFDL